MSNGKKDTKQSTSTEGCEVGKHLPLSYLFLLKATTVKFLMHLSRNFLNKDTIIFNS